MGNSSSRKINVRMSKFVINGGLSSPSLKKSIYETLYPTSPMKNPNTPTKPEESPCTPNKPHYPQLFDSSSGVYCELDENLVDENALQQAINRTLEEKYQGPPPLLSFEE